MKTFGLIGRQIDYSFSKSYFSDKFKRDKLDCCYKNFDLEKIESFESVFKRADKISGLNVTIPYKEAVIPFLDAIDKDAKTIGAVNTIKISNGKLIGYNTDHYGFLESLKPKLKPNHSSALILGTGGASKAVAFALKSMNIKIKFVSREPKNENTYIYESLTAEHISAHQLIINCTPLGTHPNTELYPPIPFHGVTKNHLLFDLVYNPNRTQFLNLGKKYNANTQNGLKMLKLQAEKSWEIWNS